MFLLDTNVISELRKQRPHGGAVAWINQYRTSQLYLSAATITELQIGADITRKQDRQKAEEIDAWIGTMIHGFPILSLDAATAREWARMQQGRTMNLLMDAMIAATAKIHGLILATRNLKDFKEFGVPLYDPFTYRS